MDRNLQTAERPQSTLGTSESVRSAQKEGPSSPIRVRQSNLSNDGSPVRYGPEGAGTTVALTNKQQRPSPPRLFSHTATPEDPERWAPPVPQPRTGADPLDMTFPEIAHTVRSKASFQGMSWRTQLVRTVFPACNVYEQISNICCAVCGRVLLSGFSGGLKTGAPSLQRWPEETKGCMPAGRSRKSVTGSSRNSGVQAKVSAWRDPKDRPQRLSGTPQTPVAQPSVPRYEGPDQELAAQLERQVHRRPSRQSSASCTDPNSLSLRHMALGSLLYKYCS